MKTSHVIFSFDAYMAADADVLPVEAHTILLTPKSLPCVSAVDIPLSLKDPLGLYPSGCKNRLSGFKPTKSATFVIL